jgi:uncharacterized protein (TIRG00374 family)
MPHRRFMTDWRVWFGVFVSAVCMWWAFKDADFGKIFDSMKRANWWLVLVAAPLQWITIMVRSYRWKYFIQRDTSTLRSKYNAVNIGFLVTNILPFRLGEIARALIFAKRLGRSRLEVFTTIATERFFDVIALIVLFAAVLPRIPFEAVHGAEGIYSFTREQLMGLSLAAVVGGLGGFAILVRFGRGISHFIVDRTGLKHPLISKVLASVFDGLEAVRHERATIPALLQSVVLWFLVGINFWVALMAFPSGETTLGAILGLDGSIFMDGVLCFAVAAPSAPGFFGVQHAATVVAFIPYPHADSDSILAFAIVSHLFAYLVTLVLGIESLKNEGVSWSEVRAVEDERVSSELDPPA